ncbi:zinc-binding dehydrogenase [Streptomyces tendae]
MIADSYPLPEAATAHREIMAGRTTGKIVLVP